MRRYHSRRSFYNKNMPGISVFFTIILLTQFHLGNFSTLFREDPFTENSNISEQFNYERDSHMGPQRWGHIWSTCRGYYQSPININSSDVLHYMPYRIVYNDERCHMRGDLVNNGHSASFYPDPKTRFLFGAPHVPNDVFVFAQMHLHFGNDVLHGSEHSLDGQFFPLEAHLVHYNVKYGDVRNASKEIDGLASIAVFIQIGRGPMNTLDWFILRHFPRIRRAERTGIKAILNPSSVLPNDRRFYTYHGSKTTPPCNDNIRWIVMKSHMTISYASFMMLQTLRDKKGQTISKNGNYRPIQPIGNRVVEANF